MKKYCTALLALAFSSVLALSSPAALATPSDAQPVDPEDLEGLEDLDVDLINDLEVGNDDLLKYILSEVNAIRSAVAPALTASASNAAPASLEDKEMDLDGEGTLGNVSPYGPVMALADTKDTYVNVIRFDAVINGDDVILLFPPEYRDSLYIDTQDRLWNLSASTIQGRIVDASFNPYATTGRLVYLTPCLGNNFSAIHNNGSPNYVRRYYWSSGRLYYDDDYVEITVKGFRYPFFVSDTLNYVFLFLLSGGVLLLWLRNYRHY